jgi:Rhs element Vgr protein
MADGSSSGLVTWTVTVAGREIPTTLVVEGIEIEQKVNRIARARIRIGDGDPAKQDFAVSASTTFAPGSAIDIGLGYDSRNASVFGGIITAQRIVSSKASASFLEVECRDAAVMLTVGRKSSAYGKSTDSDAISTVLSNAGLQADVTATSVTLDALVQYDCSDWDFIVTRAEANGLLVLTRNGTVKVFDPMQQSAAAVTLTYGIDLLGFDGVLDAVGQLAQVEANAWDPVELKAVSATASSTFAGPGNQTTRELAAAMKQAGHGLRTGAAESSDALTAWARAQVARSELAKIVATATVQGRSDLAPAQTIALAGLGVRFNGTHLITGIRHEVRRGDWICELNLGHEPTWFGESNAVDSLPAAGLLPGIHGLFNGTVLKIDSDPGHQFRIQVDVALFDDDDTGIWARMAHFYATESQGAFFLPEVGDEVVLGFLGGDPRFPIVLGSLYGKNRKPNSALTPDPSNSLKALYSKNGLCLMFDDKDKIMTLSTPAGNKLVLDDKNGQVQLVDKNGNSLQLDSDGITMKSTSGLVARASGSVTVKGDSGIAMDGGTGDVDAKGANVAMTAQTQLTMKGSASAEVQGGGQLTLKGAMVMIN